LAPFNIKLGFAEFLWVPRNFDSYQICHFAVVGAEVDGREVTTPMAKPPIAPARIPIKTSRGKLSRMVALPLFPRRLITLSYGPKMYLES
jgi:hypothetical protein